MNPGIKNKGGSEDNQTKLEVDFSNPKSTAKQDERCRCPIRDDPLATTETDALLHVVKASLGSGILAMPDAFKNSGLMLGLLGTAVVAILCTHGTYLIVKCSQELCYLYNKTSLGYTDTIETAFQTSHLPGLRKCSVCARRFVSLFLFLTYYGANTIYILLIASTMQQVCQNHLGVDWSTRCFMLILFVPLLPVAMVHQMKYLVPFSAVANVMLLVGISLTFYVTLQDLPPMTSRPAVSKDLSTLPLFFSTVLCGMEGIGTILPIENSMRNPRKLLSCPGVLNTAMIFITLLFGSIGFFGYLKFGDDVQGSVTLNMGNDILAEVVKVSIALAVFFTYALQFTACFEVVWKAAEPHISKDRKTSVFYIIRTVLIFGTVVLGILVPQLAPVISLVGSIGFSVLGLLLPAVAETLVFWREGLGCWRWRLWKNLVLVVIAFVALFSGSSVAIRDISSNYE
ncbi:proton-coupled amino acid transporter-like protein pathetic isoform X2 [Macrosteles quadrilineatus]|uniref:proton-coupled amino acid transporter-like protein pathetic isoform X2 n=1 Tax=Macrosteles quadrilineatus TaxID=74068 RepID=UPI0023E13AA4|nr:proton-coupled amino acid transporter-like protein pathetic isoform X2 [Macrosteles quadrilineatus]